MMAELQERFGKPSAVVNNPSTAGQLTPLAFSA
jgi:hypothetical protein